MAARHVGGHGLRGTGEGVRSPSLDGGLGAVVQAPEFIGF